MAQADFKGCKVYKWGPRKVTQWVKAVGLDEYAGWLRGKNGDTLLLYPEIPVNFMAMIYTFEEFCATRRFSREVTKLKIDASYEGCDPTGLEALLRSIDNKYAKYTYSLLNAGYDIESIKLASDFDLFEEGGVWSHRDLYHILANNGASDAIRMCIEDRTDKIIPPGRYEVLLYERLQKMKALGNLPCVDGKSAPIYTTNCVGLWKNSMFSIYEKALHNVEPTLSPKQ